MNNKTYKVFVYGTLKSGEHNNHFLNNSKFICKDKISGYVIYDMSVGFPFVKSKPRHIVHGEVWEVDEKTLEQINRLEGFMEGSWFNHYERVPVKTKLGHVCYVYVYLDFPAYPFKKCVHNTWSSKININNSKGNLYLK